MALPRVYDIAKELGIDTKVALAKLEELGEYVKGGSSTITPPVAIKLRAAFPNAVKPAKKEPAKPKVTAEKPAPSEQVKDVAAAPTPAPNIEAPVTESATPSPAVTEEAPTEPKSASTILGTPRPGNNPFSSNQGMGIPRPMFNRIDFRHYGVAHEVHSRVVFKNFLYLLKGFSHVNANGGTRGKEKIGHIYFALKQRRVCGIAPLIDQFKVADAVAASFALQIIVHHSWIQVRRIVDRQDPFRL